MWRLAILSIPCGRCFTANLSAAFTVGRTLLRNPTRYSTYIAVSPSIWQGDKAVLADEPAFADRARAVALNMKILIISASEEEYLGSDPVKIAERYAMIQDEGHSSVSRATIARTLTFALPAPPAKIATEAMGSPHSTHGEYRA